MRVKDQLLSLFDDYKELTVKEIVSKTSASKQMVHTVLNELVSNGFVQKLGRTPKTSYRLIETERAVRNIKIPELDLENTKLLDEHFLMVDDLGNLLKGVEAFAFWCAQRRIPFQKALEQFHVSIKTYDAFKDKNGIINGTEKLLKTKAYDKIWIDNLFYLDFYAIEYFERTPLGTLLHYAKQGQSIYLMNLLMEEIQTSMQHFIESQNADAIAFVPPTIKRETQFMKFLQANLHINLPVVEIKKVNGLIPIPQKSILKIEDRIKNAENTFAVTDPRQFKHVILIDDAVGSGATLNQIAGKIKLKGVAAEVTGLAIVGSFNEFEILGDL